MSRQNLSRIELGDQGPPAGEVITRLAEALDADEAALFRAAGRLYRGERNFEERALAELKRVRDELRTTTERLDGIEEMLEKALVLLHDRDRKTR